MNRKVVKHPMMTDGSRHVDLLASPRHVAQAKSQAEKIIEAARDEAERLVQAALEECAREQQQLLAQAVQKATNEAHERARREWKQCLLEMEEEVVKLALAVAGKVCRVEVQHNREIAAKMIRDGLAILGRLLPVVLRVHPSEAGCLRDLSPAGDDARPVTLELDASMEPGGAVLESGTRLVDAQLSTRLQHVRERLTQVDHG